MSEPTMPKPVTVAEVIARLSAFPPDTPVMVNGYEGGYTTPKGFWLTPLQECDYGGGYFGEWEEHEEWAEDPPPVVNAVVLSRYEP